ncbi:hypothetical protein U9M48_034007 [Paspalum notatum var. saurae]|uniref:Pectinesterase inhibitor domain-containing protein n=1 Tax=Paspalum notatum var. saurae TaxID=547442 RepID=A0AAQ3X6S7_PASNO
MSVKSVKTFCQPTDYKQTCEAELSKAAGNASLPSELANVIFGVTADKIHKAISDARSRSSRTTSARWARSGTARSCWTGLGHRRREVVLRR